jgi:hypothetical protein
MDIINFFLILIILYLIYNSINTNYSEDVHPAFIRGYNKFEILFYVLILYLLFNIDEKYEIKIKKSSLYIFVILFILFNMFKPKLTMTIDTSIIHPASISF